MIIFKIGVCKRGHDKAITGIYDYNKMCVSCNKEATKKGQFRTDVKKRCKKVGIAVSYYDALPKKCSFRRCKATKPGGTGDWYMDHKHGGKFRGLLCHYHNTLLGNAHDSIEELEDAIEYLKLNS